MSGVRFYQGRLVGGVLVLDAGSDAECTGVGGVPLERIAWWRADWSTDVLTVYPVAGPPIEIDYRGRGDAGQAVVDLEEALTARLAADAGLQSVSARGDALGDLDALNDVIASWAADNGLDPSDDQLNEAVYAAAAALSDGPRIGGR